jgi:hypothetical protein
MKMRTLVDIRRLAGRILPCPQIQKVLDDDLVYGAADCVRTHDWGRAALDNEMNS